MITDNFYAFEKILIEKAYKDHPNTYTILSSLPTTDIDYIDTIYDYINSKEKVYHPGKRAKTLLLGGIRGKILKKCPGSYGHLCCNYYVINLYIGCPIDCTYCILQAYLNQPFTIINVDIETIFDDLKNTLTNNPDTLFRIGTGELGDSLIYDPLTHFSKQFISFFSQYTNALFEFKTKTNFIDNILTYESPGNIVVGFSVNPNDIIQKQEGYAATIEERIAAMKKLIERNYLIALHFDPIFYIDNFETLYGTLIKKLFNTLNPENIAWISLGTFRYTPDLKSMIEYNYPDCGILENEFLENADKKYRYLKPVRKYLYETVISNLHKVSKDMLIYMCMESPEIWSGTLGYTPFKEDKMKVLFKQNNLI